MRWIDHMPEIALEEPETLGSDFTVPALSEFEMAAMEAGLGRGYAELMESSYKALLKVIHKALGLA